MRNADSIRFVIISADESLREGWAFLLGRVPGYMLAGAYSEALLKNIRRNDPDVILLDPDESGGFERIGLMRKSLPGARILLLTQQVAWPGIQEAFAKGAGGYLTKDSSPVKLIEAVQEIHTGGAPMSPCVAALIAASFQRRDQSPLSQRETEVLRLIDAGKNRSQIAADMRINVNTVKTHIKNIYVKLGAASRHQALHTARSEKLI